MPNCDFFAARSDLDLLLDFVFNHSGCRVYEHSSPFDTPAIEFLSVSEVKGRSPLGQCKGTAPSVLLQLLAPSAGEAIIERIKLNPEYCGGATFRECVTGWGLIQLYLGGESPGGLVPSHTNHNSETRAKNWEAQYLAKLGPASKWNWAEIERTSRRLNGFIRKIAVAKDGSRPILPEAAKLMTKSE
jgi:hypothetical protein